jgi:hypothetical protein
LYEGFLEELPPESLISGILRLSARIRCPATIVADVIWMDDVIDLDEPGLAAIAMKVVRFSCEP